MNVEIGKGLSNIIFGMTENEVIATLGKPDRVIAGIDDNKEFLYNSLKLKLIFDFEEGNRLYSIEVLKKEVTFLSTEVIGMSFDELLSFMKKNGYEDYEVDSYDYFDTVYFDDCSTYFTLEFNEVTSFDFSPLFKNDDKIIWSECRS